MPDKISDNEIVKALENAEYRRDGITLRGFYLDHEIIKQVIDLINRQKAEIEAWKHYYNECLSDLKNAHAENERLKKSNRNWRRKVQRLRKPLPASYVSMMVEQAERQKQKAEEFIANLKAESYKEFAERLCEGRVSNDNTVILAKCLLKELVGDENEGN